MIANEIVTLLYYESFLLIITLSIIVFLYLRLFRT